MSNTDNKAIVEKMWRALGEMDWEGMKACMHPDIHYRDVPSDDPGAHGPENWSARSGPNSPSSSGGSGATIRRK